MAQFIFICEEDALSTPIVERVKEEFSPNFAGFSLDDVMVYMETSKPDIGVVYMNSMSPASESGLQNILTKVKGIPFILVGTRDDCRRFQGYNNGEEKQFIFTPIGSNSLITQLKKTLQTLRGGSEAGDGDASSRKHILVVDDDAIFLRTMMNWLKETYRVSVVKSGPAAITFLEGHVPDLILLDYEMPDCDGLETLKMIRALDSCKDVPVVFLTGVSKIDAVREAVKLKPQGYLLKTIESKDLLLKIKMVLTDGSL